MTKSEFIRTVAAAALARFDAVAEWLGIGSGKNQGREYLPINPTRADAKPGSFTINRESGAWADFASGDKGGDLVALVAYLHGIKQGEAAERLAQFLGIEKSDAPKRATSDECAAGSAKVPDLAIGTGDEWIYENESPSSATFGTRGTLKGWQDEVAALCRGNSRLLFAVSVSFAAPLLHLVGMDGGGFHLRSNSSDGKTTAQRVAASVCGGRDYLGSWRSTDNAIESTALAHCDAPWLPDEMAQIDPKFAGETIYMLANGQAKGRQQRMGGLRARATWRVLFLSSGEIGLLEHMGEAGKSPRAGQEIRLAEIPADAGAGLGIFEELHGYTGGAELSKALTEAARRNYGGAFVAYLESLTRHQHEVADTVKEAQRKFQTAYLTDQAHGQARRVADRFSLVGAAGELAQRWGIVPWEPGEAMQAARTCFDAWLARRGGEGNQEERAALRQVREFLRRYGESAFTDMDRPANDTDKHAPVRSDRAGYRRHDATADAVEYFIFTEVWRTRVCKGFDAAAVGRAMAARGFVERGTETGREWLTRHTIPTEGRPRVVHVLPAIWDDEGDGNAD